MPKFSTVKIPADARERLLEIRDHLARRLGGSVSVAQATVASIDTLHRIQNDPDLALTSRKRLVAMARKIADDMNERNADAVCGAVRELTGIEPEIERSANGRYYTIRANGKSVMLADPEFDLPAQLQAMH